MMRVAGGGLIAVLDSVCCGSFESVHFDFGSLSNDLIVALSLFM